MQKHVRQFVRTETRYGNILAVEDQPLFEGLHACNDYLTLADTGWRCEVCGGIYPRHEEKPE